MRLHLAIIKIPNVQSTGVGVGYLLIWKSTLKISKMNQIEILEWSLVDICGLVCLRHYSFVDKMTTFPSHHTQKTRNSLAWLSEFYRCMTDHFDQLPRKSETSAFIIHLISNCNVVKWTKIVVKDFRLLNESSWDV